MSGRRGLTAPEDPNLRPAVGDAVRAGLRPLGPDGQDYQVGVRVVAQPVEGAGRYEHDHPRFHPISQAANASVRVTIEVDLGVAAYDVVDLIVVRMIAAGQAITRLHRAPVE